MNNKFIKSCIRDPKQKYVDINYINNMKKGMSFFGGWFRGYNNIRDCSFRKILKIHHSIISNEYAGYTNPINEIPKSIIRDEQEVILYKPVLKQEWYTEELKKYNLKIGQKKKIEIKDMPLEKCHSIKMTKDGLKLYLPTNIHIKYYILRMEHIMKILKNKDYNKNVLNLLGYYIHLGVICHPFEKVNFSLIMSQVNYILNYYGYESISHGYLDFECFLKTTDEVIKSFKNKVRRKK